MDVGKEVVSRRGSGEVKRLAHTVEGKMGQWTEDNFEHFQEAMDLIREGAPIQYAKIYMEAVKLGIERTSTININISRQKDHEDLQALVRTRIHSLSSEGSYTPYEEVNQKEPLTIKKEEDV